MRIGWRCRAVDGIATSARPHEHDAHAIGMAAIDRLQVAMIECVLAQDCDHALDSVFIRNRAMLLDPTRRIFISLTAQTHDDVGERFAEELILGLATLLKRLQLCWTFFFE